MIWAMADLHLSCNPKTKKSMDKFGEQWKNYMERIEAFCKSHISPSDILLIPGDISWAMSLKEAEEDLAFLHRLPGLKILSRGNHDYWWTSLSKMYKFCELKGWNSLLFLRFQAVRIELNKRAEVLGFFKAYGDEKASIATSFSERTLLLGQQTSKKCSSEIQKTKRMHEVFISLDKNIEEHINREYEIESAVSAIVIASTRAWLNPGDRQFQEEKDRNIYERESERLRLVLEDAKNHKKKGDILLAMLHYPVLLKTQGRNTFIDLIEEDQYQVDMCCTGHLHGQSAKYVFQGEKDGRLFFHVAADALEMKALALPLSCKLFT